LAKNDYGSDYDARLYHLALLSAQRQAPILAKNAAVAARQRCRKVPRHVISTETKRDTLDAATLQGTSFSGEIARSAALRRALGLFDVALFSALMVGAGLIVYVLGRRSRSLGALASDSTSHATVSDTWQTGRKAELERDRAAKSISRLLAFLKGAIPSQ
jgi:hypothetical protein